MGLLKEMAVREEYYIERGTDELDAWRTLMIDEFGQHVKPFLTGTR